ncbi:von Willebrand factor A domain-containing protein 3B [Holothuria leucospilota]|uniref:von Willebrand factor A domain-containing protein 3B n=1 Tax=Holothuria leucospilota TaxID=206669 RepID=A0A9Q1BJY5_HOLLE|nr:von Willebrand factor A domain-containing protein 3B [Holothuria leucospilota]
MYEVEPGRVVSPNEMNHPNFDLKPRERFGQVTRETKQPSIKGMSIEEVFSVIKLKPPPKKTWEPDVKALISTPKWLSTYGLKRNRLTLDQILGTIGFKHSDDYDHALKKPVCSRYGEGMFKRYPKRDGKVYNVNVTVSKEKIKQIENSLLQAINLYKRRIEWLTSESRRLFGVTEEHCVCIVIDIKTHSPAQFDHCRNALIKVLEEQISQIAKFNLIRAAQDMVVYSDTAVPVTRDSLDQAATWIRQLDSVAATTKTSACEAILRAFQDRNIECVYLFSEGNSSDTAMELTLQKLKGGPLPVHSVAFNSANSTTIKFLKDVAKVTGGRFHAFAFNKLDSDVSGTSGYNVDSTLHGGVPPGAGSRDDVVAMWAELEEARNILQDVQLILDEVPDAKETNFYGIPIHIYRPKVKAIRQEPSSSSVEKNEQYMGSAEWMNKHGLKARKLDLYDVLATCSFKHCDGVVDLRRAPDNDYTDADTMNKLVGAKYCDKFCHFQWKDGSIKHVHVTADIHRQYERKMIVALQDFQRRIDWLQQGSRELFGTIIEDEVYILIDVSNSMENHLSLVKEKLYKLMQEQLRHKRRFNLVKFGSKAQAWRDRMVEVNEGSLQSAWQWVRDLNVAGSTNTLAALKFALGDPSTQAVYLLSDGRPDHPPKTVLAQVQLQRKTPIHAISFNCNDHEANDFLATLAADSGGRYHYYSDDLSFLPEGPVPFESEDVRLLKEEIKKGRDDLIKLGKLREQCALLDWSNNGHDEDGCGKDHGIRKRPSSAVGNRPDPAQVLSRDFSSPVPSRSSRPKSAQPWTRRTLSSLSTSHNLSSSRQRTTSFPPKPHTPSRSSSKVKPNVTYHTKTSWLRLNGSLDGWTLPETRNLLNEQQKRYMTALNESTRTKDETSKGKKKRKSAHSLRMSSRQWLRKHGLAAKKLTIYDALGGSMVRQRAKYVPILDKYVTSQVFNEIMPIAHVTNNKQEVNLINPGAVDLVSYEEKLQDAIKLYNKRLDQVAWNALTPEERNRFGSDEPVSFQENRKDYLLSLEQLGWPVSEKDIILLEEEVEKAERFLFQSKSLRQASGKSRDNSTKHTPRLFPNANRSSDRIHNLLEQVASSIEGSNRDSDSEKEGEEEKALSNEKSSSESGSEDELNGLKESDDETGLKEEDEDSGKEAEEEVTFEVPVKTKVENSKLFKPAHKSKKVTKKTKNLRLSRGIKVIGRNMEDGLYYPGIVMKNKDARNVEVKFDSLGRQTVASRFVIETTGARAVPKLGTGDYVLVRGLKGKAEVWVPGIVQFGPKEEARQAKFYTVITYNKHKINVVRSSLTKIAQSRYNFMVRYICSIHQPARPLLLTSNPDGKRPYLRAEDLNEEEGNPKYPFLVRPISAAMEAQTDTPELVATEVQADETSPEDIREILKDLQMQLAKNQDDSKISQEELRQELGESIKQREALDKAQEELRLKHEHLLEQHSNVQRESDRLLSRHNRLKKKHVELRDRHGKVKNHKDELEQKEKDVQQRFQELNDEHSNLKMSFDNLHAEHLHLQDKYKAQEEKRERLTDSGIQTEEMVLDVVEEVDKEIKPEENGENKEEEDEETKEVEVLDEKTVDERQQMLKQVEKPSLIGEEVLARSAEDGWFYRGTVESATEGGYYFIADSNETIQKVEEKWLLTDENDAKKEIQAGDAVVALHPEYPYRYGPALVQQQGANLWYQLVFYDGITVDAPREEMYFLDKSLYSDIKEAILDHEDKWVSHAVVVRKDETGKYALGTVVERINRGNFYKIEWADGSISEQHSQHIFGAFSRRQRMALGDYVLGMLNFSSLTYLPGEIVEVNGNKLVVQFIDGSSSNTVDTKQCFWLSEAYYIQAKDFFLDKNSIKADSSPPSSDSESSVTSVSSQESKKKQKKKKEKSRKLSSSSSSSGLSLLG